MSTMKDIIHSPLLLILVIIGLLYIVGFSIVPSLSIVVGLFALISILGTVWSW